MWIEESWLRGAWRAGQVFTSVLTSVCLDVLKRACSPRLDGSRLASAFLPGRHHWELGRGSCVDWPSCFSFGVISSESPTQVGRWLTHANANARALVLLPDGRHASLHVCPLPSLPSSLGRSGNTRAFHQSSGSCAAIPRVRVATPPAVPPSCHLS